ncbi:MAG: LysR family transcriptional regulator [Bryobacterales bacterium]|nr:LysR family transcriptional regulator [Acidobacteriota bacterium]MCB9383430.1 LysR family transcriptional regulator [Bryobacterales bacterium]
MDFDQLNTFLEIVRLKSFSKAAQTCFRTQPAISAQIRQMEQELGTQLFERFGSRISLTTAGKIFSDYARQILETKRQAFDEVRELEKVPRGEITIAANEATCVKVLPEVFADYKKRFPGVQIQVVRSHASQTLQSVLDNSVDFGITQLPVTDKKIAVVQVHSDEIRLLVPPDHPLASQNSVRAEDVAKYPLLLPKQGRTRSRIDEYLEDFEDDLTISMELESSEMVKQFIRAGLGVGFMAVTHAGSELRHGELVALRIEPLPMIRTIGLIYRKDKALSRAGLGFIEVIADFARNAANRETAPERRVVRSKVS